MADNDRDRRPDPEPESEPLEEGVKQPRVVRGAPFPPATRHSDGPERPRRHVPSAHPRPHPHPDNDEEDDDAGS